MNSSLSCNFMSIIRPLALIAIVGFSSPILIQDADARRLGGGGSFGRQSATVMQRPATLPAQSGNAPTQGSSPMAAPAQTTPKANYGLGIMTGLAAGLGIAALMSHFGLEGAFGDALSSILMIGLLLIAGMFIWRLLRMRGTASQVRVSDSAYQAALPMTETQAQPVGIVSLENAITASPALAARWGIPADFDVAAFVRSAKVNFIRLQAAWDAGNLADIREFTSPEMFAEVRLQIAEATGKNETDVVRLEAELLGIECNEMDYLASVRFSGSMRENRASDAEPFEEVWNLTKAKDGKSGWLLAGIQQVH